MSSARIAELSFMFRPPFWITQHIGLLEGAPVCATIGGVSYFL